MSTGRLMFDILGATIARPLSNSKIVVSRTNEQTVIEELFTNDSGQTNIIELPSPPKDLSLEPGSSEKPYAEYDAMIQSEGYEPLEIRGIQVLTDVTAIQPANLLPTSGMSVQQQREITINPHTLWGEYPPKIPEDAVKPLPDETGFVVLDEPVVPEYVIVHDGLPDNPSAPNYWVNYKDYIKNVASSEIYATWSDSSIRANILAIISFTLNRVFTEWYRGKGKDFTITSSTAYDHKFIYGRNVFQEISVVVDEMFSTYITKPNIKQPLFTQYCDGKNVQCPGWMAQWGAMELGAQGYDAVSILRNYYGYDIYLDVAQNIAGVPSSFQTNLQVGSRGNAVRIIQSQLNTISNNYPAIPKTNIDGIYGEGTMSSVQTFQSIFGLPATGVVDYPTWYRISDVYVAVSRIAELY